MMILQFWNKNGQFDVNQKLNISYYAIFCLLLSIYCSKAELRETIEYEKNLAASIFHEDLSHLPWDHLDLQFLNNVKGSSLHNANEFHVVNATFSSHESGNSSYIIHISKPQNLFHPELLGFSGPEAEDMKCIFSGIITKTAEDEKPSGENGLVSLSSCHHKIGFEGLILLPHEKYYIQPSASFRFHHPRVGNISKRSTDSNNPVIPHKAFKVNGHGSELNGHQAIDELRHPPADLIKKAEKLSTNTDHFEDENIEKDDSTENVVDPPCLGAKCFKNSFSPVMATLAKSKTNILKSSRNKNKNKNTNKGGGKKKTPPKTQAVSSNTKVVEIAVFTDESLLRIWQSRYPQKTQAALTQYVLAVINNMNALYLQPSMTDKVTFRLVHLEIETKRPGNLQEHNGFATKYLTSFCHYAEEKNQQGALWDHALLLTGIDLKEGGSNATAGVAWFCGMCVRGVSCSLIEGMTFNSAFITAHEIGHNLGMEHDGEGANRACDPNSYLMSPTTGGGKSDWSKCTVAQMKNFINNGFGPSPPPKCIFNKGAKAGNAIKFSNSKLPGQLFNARTQCEANCKGCTPYTKPPYQDICQVLYCQYPNTGIFFVANGYHPALEGTTCGRGKMCRVGKCV